MSNITRQEVIDGWESPANRKQVQATYDEYAKQQIISYEIWLEMELNNDSSFNYEKTPNQLYDLFIQSQQNKQ